MTREPVLKRCVVCRETFTSKNGRGECGPCRYKRYGKAQARARAADGSYAPCPRCHGASLKTHKASWGSFNKCGACGYGNKVVDYSFYDRRGLPRPEGAPCR